MQKKIIPTVVATLLCFTVFAQQKTKTAIAPFKIEQANGKFYTSGQLEKNISTTLVYFSPTCDHCKLFLKQVLQQKDLSTKQIVMITYLPVDELTPFVAEFNLNNYPNIKVGTEGYSFTVRKYYNVQRFPFIAVYDKQLHLKKILPYTEDATQAVSQLVKVW